MKIQIGKRKFSPDSKNMLIKFRVLTSYLSKLILDKGIIIETTDVASIILQ